MIIWWIASKGIYLHHNNSNNMKNTKLVSATDGANLLFDIVDQSTNEVIGHIYKSFDKDFNQIQITRMIAKG